MRKIDLKSVVWKEGNYYISQCLEVDVSSFGKTKKEALALASEWDWEKRSELLYKHNIELINSFQMKHE